VIVWLPADVEVNMTEQVAGPAVVVEVSRHPSKGLMPPSAVKLTLPVGALLVPVAVSVTVAVHVVEPPAWNDAGAQLTAVVVDRFVTLTDVLPLLSRCAESPP
jgi:hypothetical protein